MTHLVRSVLYVVALIVSYPASWINLVHYSSHRPPKYTRAHKPTRHCVLCGAAMVRDFRPERDGRRQGKIIKIPEDILNWWRCPPEDGCGQSQQGEMKT